MGRSAPRWLDSSSTRLFLVFGLVVGSFLLTAVVTEQTSARIESLSDRIASETSPSVQRLATLRATTVQVELIASRYLQEKASGGSSLGAPLDNVLERLSQDIAGYLTAPNAPADQRDFAELQRAWLRFDLAVRRARNLADAGNARDARTLFAGEVEATATGLLDQAMRIIERKAQHGAALAAEIKERRRRMVWFLDGLTAFSAFLGVAGAFLIDHQARHRRALVDAHARHLEKQAAELEQFAGRVAHDIRGPLTSVTLAAQMIERSASDEKTMTLAARIRRGLARAEAINAGLLEFARAGARPDPGARTSPRAVIADLTSSVAQESAGERIVFRVEEIPNVLVACSEGVYLSLVSNLVRNAIKYMGDSSIRQVTVRAVVEGAWLRTEVVDTGPGIADENLRLLFEPYFQARKGESDGLGLGLATVRKLAEGHGGRAGVESVPGKGSTFWFTLPRAGRAEGEIRFDQTVETHTPLTSS